MKEYTLKNNFIYNTIYVLIVIGYPLILTPYLSRILKADGIGRVDYAISIVNFFMIVASLGIPNYGIREIAKNKDDKRNLYKIFMELIIINVISSIICSIVYYIFVSKSSFLEEYRNILYMLGILLIANSFQTGWFFQGITNYKIITIRSLCVKLLTLIVVFAVVKDREDYYKYVFVYVLSHVGENIFNAIKCCQYLNKTKVCLEIRKHVQPIMIMFSTQLAVNVYANLDTFMLGSMAGTETVGYYSNAHKIIKLLASLAASLSSILLPRLSLLVQNKEYGQLKILLENVLYSLLFFSFAFGIGVVLVADELIPIFCGQGYEKAVDVLRIMSIMIPILTIGNLFGTQVLLTFHAEKKLLYSVIFSAVVNFVLNILLIGRYQQNGVAIASVAAEMCALGYQYYQSRKYIKLKIDFYELLKEGIALIAMILARMIICQNVYNIYVRFGSTVIVGAAIYIILAIILKNRGYYSFIRILKEKV